MVEQRGARVFLFELPYSEPIEGSRFAATTREIVHAAFPDQIDGCPSDSTEASCAGRTASISTNALR